MKPQQKRLAVGELNQLGYSKRSACELVSLERKSFYYKSKSNEFNAEISLYLRELALQYVRWGSPRLIVAVRDKFGAINHKRVERLYAKANLQIPKRPRRHLKYRSRPLPAAARPNHRWSMDFVSGSLMNGRKFRVFNLIDDFTRELLLQIVDTSISGVRIARELTELSKTRALPEYLVSDNGPEFRSAVMFKWAKDNKVELSFIAPGKPQQNAFVESLNGKFRVECLDLNWFTDLFDARDGIRSWNQIYNKVRPHSSLKYLTPEKYRQTYDNNVDN